MHVCTHSGRKRLDGVFDADLLADSVVDAHRIHQVVPDNHHQ